MAERVLSIRVVGDSAQGTKALTDVEKAAGKVDPAAKTAGSALNDVKSKLLGLVPGGQAAQSTLGKVGEASEGTGATMKGALVGGAAAAGVALAGMAAQGVQKFASLTGEVSKFKNVSGATSEEASKLIAVAKGMGVETDVLSTAMFKLGATVQATPSKLTDLGIAIARNKNGTVDLVGTLENASEAYRNSTDATQKDAIAKALGGKAGAALIPILKQGKDAVDEFAKSAKNRGLIFSDKDLKQGADFRASMRDLGQAGSALEIELGKGLVPALTDVTEAATAGADALNKITAPIGGLGGAIDKSMFGVHSFVSLLKDVGLVNDDASKSADKHAQSVNELTGAVGKGVDADQEAVVAADATTKAEKQTAKAIEDRKKAVDDLSKAQVSQIDTDLAYRKSVDDLGQAIADYKDRQKAATDALKAHGAKSVEATAAAADLEKQTLQTADSIISFAKASVAQQQAQAEANGQTWDAGRANEALKGALQGVANTLDPKSPLRAQLQGYIGDLKSTPQNVATVARLETDQAVSDFRSMERDFMNSSITVPIRIDASGMQSQVQQIFANLGAGAADTFMRTLRAGVR